VANYKTFSELLTKNYSSKTQKNSPTRSAKADASVVGGMFTVIAMSCWRERFTEVGTESRLLGTVPWCAIAAYNVAWKAMAMAMA